MTTTRGSPKKGPQKHLEGSEWEQFRDLVPEDTFRGIVAANNRGLISILKDRECLNAILPPSYPKSLINTIVVGDLVEVEKSKYNNFVRYRLPRRKSLSRIRGDRTRNTEEKQVIAANVDLAVVVASTKQPKFQPRLIDRYLVISQYGHVVPIICLNKVDLTNERHPILKWYQEKLGIPVIETSATTGTGIEKLRKAVRGKTCVFVGHSGVGKSSLLNALKRELQLKVTSVSKKTGRGRHATTSINLYPIDENTYVIDTPGIRSLGLTHIKKDDLSACFPEFSSYQSRCKYSDCQHHTEDKCAVKEALTRGEINHYRYESYLRILSELKD